jgi:biopolymer transport protein ExbD
MAKKKARRGAAEAGLSITSMMDMMTIILVFLLKNYQTESVTVAASEDLQIPLSSAQKSPKLAVNVIVSRKDIVVDGTWVLDLQRSVNEGSGAEEMIVPDDEKKGQLIAKLYDILLEKAETAKDLGAQTGSEEFAFKGEVLLQVDKRMPFSVVREVMFTAGQAQFSNFRFVVIKNSG